MREQKGTTVVELSQEELIAWISKQLSLGIRGVIDENEGVSGIDNAVSMIDNAFKLKKEIVKTSKQISSYVNNILVEEWRLIETELALLDQRRKIAEQKAMLQSLKDGSVEVHREEILSCPVIKAEVTINGSSYVREYIDLFHQYRKQVDSVWKGIESQYEEDLLARKAEDELLETDAKANRKFVTTLSEKRQKALDEYLNERFILKRQKARREETERELRRELAALSSQLHAKRDLERVKGAVAVEETVKRDTEKEAKEREMEWRLMDEEINLTRKLKSFEEKTAIRNEKICDEMAKLQDMYSEEREFVDSQMRGVEFFRAEIAGLRAEVKEIEQTVSRFKSYLRHAKREERMVRE